VWVSTPLTTFRQIAGYQGDTLRRLQGRGRLWAPTAVTTVTLSRTFRGRPAQIVARLPELGHRPGPAHVSALLDAYARAAATGDPNQPRT
jgi:hypothetical protein